ncbi:hypothetical protein L218DRAFT_626346 [Marasmius fiardii PR-910]|nr:hypothetical protein L218DRAFT_626346 [Marasmius fiardii PR-910]
MFNGPPATSLPFNDALGIALCPEDMLENNAGGPHGLSQCCPHAVFWEDSMHHDHPWTSLPLSSYPRYIHNGVRVPAPMASHDFNLLQSQEACEGASSYVDEQDYARRLQHDCGWRMNDGLVNEFPATLAPPSNVDNRNSHSTPVFPCPAVAASPPGHYADYNNSQPSPSDTTNRSPSVEPEDTTRENHSEYRQTVASPKVAAANKRRRKKGARSFPCSNCEATFTTKQNLNHHLNSHYNIKPFSCDHCRRPFGHASDLRRHLKWKVCLAVKKKSAEEFIHCSGLPGSTIKGRKKRGGR